jgi:hypothetical protein
MKAMIPHHSSAIIISKHANIKEPEVGQLADSIGALQKREIIQMEGILRRIGKITVLWTFKPPFLSNCGQIPGNKSCKRKFD